MTRLQALPPQDLNIFSLKYGHQAPAENLPARDAGFFQREGTVTHFGKGDLILTEGAQVRGVHLLVRGKIKVYRDLMPGRRQIFHFHSPGDLLGCQQVLNEEAYGFQAEALEECQTIFIPTEVFLKHARQSPAFTQYLLEQQAREFSTWMKHYGLTARRSVRVRLAICLLNLHELSRLPGNPTTVIHLSRTDLADYAATTLETTVRVMRELKEAGLIHVRGRRIMVLDMPGLIQVSQEIKLKKPEA